MRKLPAVLGVVGLAAVTLVGCSSSAADSCTPVPSASTSVLDQIAVTGDADAQPDIELNTPFRVNKTQYAQVERGSGTPIVRDDQLVVLDLSIVDGSTGEVVAASAYNGDQSAPFVLANATESIPPLGKALRCAAAGSRVVLALAPGDIAEQTAAGFGIDPESSAVAVIDVRKVYLDRANGALQYNARTGMPSVVRAPDGRPGVIIPDGAPPEDLAVQVLKRGTGEKVAEDDSVRVHYTGLVWDDKSVFDSTWDAEPASLALSSTVPGFADALAGQTVGSQVLVVVPPDQGYGDAEQGSIPANSTLVFVVDILGIDAPAAG